MCTQKAWHVPNKMTGTEYLDGLESSYKKSLGEKQKERTGRKDGLSGSVSRRN